MTDQSEGSQEENSSSVISFNSADKTIYHEEISEYDGIKNQSYGKTMLNGDNLYIYFKEVSPDNSEPKTTLHSIQDKDKAEYQDIETLEPYIFISMTYEGIKLANSIDELKSAMTTALPDILENSYFYSFMGSNDPTINSTVSAKINDEISTLIIDIKSSTNITNDDISATLITNISHEISAKNDKIIEYKAIINIGVKQLQGSTVITDYNANMNISTTYDYSFAKDKYDALKVTVPENPSDIPVMNPTPTEYEDTAVTLYINGIKNRWSVEIPPCNTPQEALHAIIRYTDTIKGNVRVFADEAMTQEITEDNVTKEMILGLTEVYIELTPKPAYAFVIESYSTRNDFSKPYNIVISTLYLVDFDLNLNYERVDQNLFSPETYTLDEDFVVNSNCEIWINGVKQEPNQTTVTLEAGKTYKIEYIEILSEKYLNQIYKI